MPDPIFQHPRLVAIHDALDPDRRDLDIYAAMVDEFRARSVVDLGCGTGLLARMPAARGMAVTGVDPASGSVAYARADPAGGWCSRPAIRPAGHGSGGRGQRRTAPWRSPASGSWRPGSS